MTKNTVHWEMPPPKRGGGRYDWAAIGAALMKQPGEWAVAVVADSSGASGRLAYHIRTGVFAALRELGQFEAKARMVDGENRVYARYVGTGA